MEKLNKEFEFILSEPVKFAHNGDQETGFKITLKAPGNIHSRFCNKLSKGFYTSAQKMAESQAGKKQEEAPTQDAENTGMTGEMIVMAMTMNGDIDGLHEAFKDLLCFSTPHGTGSVCMIEGKCPMTKSIYDEMLLADTNRLLGEYLKNFLIPS